MKKTIFSAIIALAGLLPAQAQTDFRHISFNEAVEAAKAENKQIFIDFYTEWCGPCKRMAAKVLPTKEVGDYLNANFVCIKIDAEKGEGPKLAELFSIQAYPTFVIAGTDGKIVGSLEGYREAPDFITGIQMCCDPDLTPERVKARYEAGERSGKLVNAYAQNIIDTERDYRAAYKKATEIVDEYYATLSDADRLKPENAFMYIGYTHEYSNPRVPFMVANIDSFAPETRERIKEKIQSIYKQEAMRYFTNNLLSDPANKPAYEKFKKEMADLGWADEYKNMFSAAETHAGMDNKAFLAFCDENFSTFTEEERSIILQSLTSMFAPATPEETKAVSAFARKYIGQLPARDMMFVADSIYRLEAPSDH